MVNFLKLLIHVAWRLFVFVILLFLLWVFIATISMALTLHPNLEQHSEAIHNYVLGGFLILATIITMGYLIFSKCIPPMHDFFRDIFSYYYLPAMKGLSGREAKKEKISTLNEAIEGKYPFIKIARYLMETIVLIWYFNLSYFNFEEIIVADITDIALWIVSLIIFRVVVLNLLEGWLMYRLITKEGLSV